MLFKKYYFIGKLWKINNPKIEILVKENIWY